jgi:pimeloyl-ACP methyl ester carboxylesterase
MVPLVLLPAMLCDGELYRDQVGALADLAEPLHLSASASTMAEAARSVLSRAPARFALAGTSAGGNLALEIVASAPERIAGLWLMGANPGAHPDPGAAARLAARVEAGEYDAVAEELMAQAVYANGPRAAEAAATLRRMARRFGPDAFLRASAALRSRPARWDALDGLRGPTLLLWGQHDEFVSVERAHEIAARVKSARLVVLEACGHLPTLEQPDTTTRAARDWLKSIEAAGG